MRWAAILSLFALLVAVWTPWMIISIRVSGYCQAMNLLTDRLPVEQASPRHARQGMERD